VSESIPTNALKFCLNASTTHQDRAASGFFFFFGSGVDHVGGRFLSGFGPGLGVYRVAGRFFSSFGTELSDVVDKAERERPWMVRPTLRVVHLWTYRVVISFVSNLLPSYLVKPAREPLLVMLKCHCH
jgi:hypothetical protein